MKVILLLLFAIFGIVVNSCPPPFNDFRYLKNNTLFEELLSSRLDAPSDAQFAGAHVIYGHRQVAVWPINGPSGVTIPFCYSNIWTRNRLREAFEAGVGLWVRKLGPPGPAHSHRMFGFKEATYPDGRPCPCYLPTKDWNPIVPPEAVQIVPLEGPFRAEATLGYIPAAYKGNVPRHKLAIAHNPGTYDLANRAFLVAHEVGHIFGLVHEHQRPDRDHYVHFDCSKLPNYDRVKTHLEQNPRPGVTLDMLCNDSLWPRAPEYRALGWGAAADYSTAPWWDQSHKDENGNLDGQNNPVVIQAHGSYDYDSIMHYMSTINMPLGGVKQVSNVALVAWKQYQAQPPGQADEENAQLIVKTTPSPSDGDFRLIQYLYPWN